MKYNLIIAILFTVFIAACSSNNHPIDLTKTESKKAVSGYEIGKVVERPLSGYVKLPGQLKPFEEVNIFAKINSFVKTVYVDRGSIVHKGQILARLEAPELGAQLQTANSKLIQIQENAAASKERYERLKEAAKEPGAVAPLELDNARSRMKADQAAVLSEKASLSAVSNINDYLVITASFDGTIVQRNVSAGALVGSGKSGDLPMFVLQQSQKLRLEVMIPEDYVDKVDLSRGVNFMFNAKPGVNNTARISRSANALGSMHSEAIEIDVNNATNELKPGMYAEVKIPLLSDVKSLIVPSNAIVRSTERIYVITVQNNKAHLEDIKEGLKSNDSSNVFGQLQNGEEIILHATDEIKEGTAVR